MTDFSVLIVDDEFHAIRGVEIGVDWEKLGIANVHKAYSAAQAREILLSEEIDLLLTDIEMPGASGLDLLRWVRSCCPEVEAIILTGHPDFEYAQEALQLSSLNYLLKPLDCAELEAAIGKALEKIERERYTRRMQLSFAELEEMHQRQMREDFWLGLIRQDAALNPHDELEYDPSCLFLPILIRICKGSGQAGPVLKDLIQKCLSALDREAAVIRLSDKHFAAIISGKAAGRMQDLRELLKAELCLYLGRKVPPHEVGQVVRQLQDRDWNNVTLTPEIIPWEHIAGRRDFIPSIPKEEWIKFMLAGAKDELKQAMEENIGAWRAEPSLTRSSLHSFYQDLLQIIFYVLQTEGLEANQVFSRRLFEEYDEHLDTVDSLTKWVLSVIDVVMDHLVQPQGENSAVAKAKRYIDENLGRHGLVREDVAKHVFFNEDYLGRIFKKETGLSLSEYILTQRIERAKSLLLGSESSISEIALQCGYSNFSYFSTLFRKHTGLSPTDFREQHGE